ncbi:SLATT domain-containing protein [Methylobacter tundripaludum]|uniref:SLATT domain-containing protein n=1 Tax=Methylobacter tundripaludum TaxID=173365 RepID=UPI0004DEFF8A|nr:SLATT domain-containing protein [Methylobacter tundripaludum]
MKKDELLKHIARTAYNVGFGAKKHFATYDIVQKAPGLISFFSLGFGIFGLVFVLNEFLVKLLSASFVLLGIVGLYISFYDKKKDEYEKIGIELTKLFNKLGKLYSNVKDADENDLVQYEQELSNIEVQYYENCKSDQILFSDWYAHYKFFWQHQIDWINEQKEFTFLRDKIPLSFSLVAIIILIVLILNSNIPSKACGLVLPWFQ